MGTSVEACARVLHEGGVVLHATEGVWGFACDPHCETAVREILAIKGREAAKGLLIIGSDVADFEEHLSGLGHRHEVEASWPGHHTWVLPNKNRYGTLITGGRDTIACRVPDHAQARDLCKAFGGPLVSTSANRSAEPPVTEEREGRVQFAGEVDCILPGRTNGVDAPSTIHGLDGAILR